MVHIAISQICVNWIFFIFLHELAKRANTFKPSAKNYLKTGFCTYGMNLDALVKSKISSTK